MSDSYLNLNQKQIQTLKIGPQLQNSLKILQSASLDLRTAILSELQKNPLLEELPQEGISVEEEVELIEESPEQRTEELDFSDDDFSILERIVDDNANRLIENNPVSAFDQEKSERKEHFINSLTKKESLQEHLLEQVSLNNYDKKIKEVLIYLIGSLDENGFLVESPSNLGLQIQKPYHEIIEGLSIIKTFHPIGVGAKDTRECLLIQLDKKGRNDSLAYKIIEKNFDLLLRRRIEILARNFKTSTKKIELAIEEISLMDPTPGKRFIQGTNSIIQPDINIFYENDNLKIELNNEYIPKLRINQKYKDLLAQGNLTKKEKNFLIENLRSGKFLINSIEQRQNTLKKISNHIIKAQPDFFSLTKSKLRPLTMQYIAEKIGIHETTVSRAIANKFVNTPHGVFPMKYFFNSGFKSNKGESIANESVKDKIEKIISKEDPEKPISDEKIKQMLNREGIKIARRTIAKYREQKDILPSNLRKRFN